ncbi:MAG TPA: acetate uptake transporter [Mycobacterium sp.]|jgi:succinate-acetate transporter protein|nr:acetate uptake transporter [Mycobacterium sp.]
MTHTNGTTVMPERTPLHETWTKAGPVVSHLPAAQVHELQEVSEASIGDPGAMSLFGFAVGTLLVALPISGEMAQSTIMAAIPALLIFGGIGQFIGGLFAYRKGNTFAATAFCSFGANNVVVSTFFLFQAIGLIPDNNDSSTFLAIDLFCFAYIAFVLFLASFKLNAAFVLVLLALFPGYGLSAVGNLSSMPVVIGQIGGWFLICSAGLAFYSGGALALNSTYERTVLPMFSRA